MEKQDCLGSTGRAGQSGKDSLKVKIRQEHARRGGKARHIENNWFDMISLLLIDASSEKSLQGRPWTISSGLCC